jgi:hypothetical protein
MTRYSINFKNGMTRFLWLAETLDEISGYMTNKQIIADDGFGIIDFSEVFNVEEIVSETVELKEKNDNSKT